MHVRRTMMWAFVFIAFGYRRTSPRLLSLWLCQITYFTCTVVALPSFLALACIITSVVGACAAMLARIGIAVVDLWTRHVNMGQWFDMHSKIYARAQYYL